MRISGFTDFTYKWETCTETEGAIVNDILASINGITTEPDRTFRCIPKIKYILVSTENFDKSQIVSNIMKSKLCWCYTIFFQKREYELPLTEAELEEFDEIMAVARNARVV